MFYDDAARAFGEELQSLYEAGCRHAQMDDTNLAYLCDENMRETARQRGDDPNELPHRNAGFINKVVAHKPAGMTLAMHRRRGNFKSTHTAAGNDERSGDVKPLRYLTPGKVVALGPVTTEFGRMESKDDLKRRIDEVARYAPRDQLCPSPQCGCSSTVHGNIIAVEDQRNKLRLVVEVAQRGLELRHPGARRGAGLEALAYKIRMAAMSRWRKSAD